MLWELIDLDEYPKCVLCNNATKKMLKFNNISVRNEYRYICYTFAEYIRDIISNQKRSTEYIEDVGKEFDSKYIDKVIEENKDKAQIKPDPLFPDVDISDRGGPEVNTHDRKCACGNTGRHRFTSICD